jgi:metallo-beta-lactamase family protein
MLLDAARIQTEDSAYKQKRHQREKRRGRYPEMPLYTEEDAERVFPLLKTVGYDEPFTIGDHLEVKFHDAGHILGSALIEVNLKENGTSTRIVFSGDLGQWKKPLVRDPTLLSQADYVVMESTYGDRNHAESGPVDTQLVTIINQTVQRRGNVIIPVFALERAQELMYHISALIHSKRIPEIPVFVDSPMAAEVTQIFQQFADFFDQETFQRIAAASPPLSFPGLRFARTVQESKDINRFPNSCVIMSTSGMCTDGRIKHHLRNNIQRPESTVLFVGYQGAGTLGRRILDREPFVRIHGQDYRVRADVQQITGFSAHADQEDLLRWIGHFQPGPRRVFLTHGEEQAALTLAELIRKQQGWEVSVPRYEDTFQLK